jgi:hypothetical protein
LVVERRKRSPTIPMRPGTHAPSFRTSTLSIPSTDSVIRRIVPRLVRYTSEECTPSVYAFGVGPGRGSGDRANV